MAIEYKSSTTFVNATWTDALTVPAGKKAIVSSIAITNDGSSGGSRAYRVRKLNANGNSTLISAVAIASTATTNNLVAKIVLEENEKLQTLSYENGILTNYTIKINQSDWFLYGFLSYPNRIISNDQIRVSVGHTYGQIGLSTDKGQTWTRPSTTMAVTESGNSVAYANGVYVIGSSAGKIFTSSNGVTWTARTNPLSSQQSVFEIKYANNAFFALTTDSSAGRLLRSANGTSWTSVHSLDTNVLHYDIAHNGTIFVATTSNTTSNQIITSSDGTSWTNRTVPATFDTVFAIGSKFYAQQGNFAAIYTSDDGISWTEKTDSAEIKFMLDASYSSGKKLNYKFTNNTHFMFFVSNSSGTGRGVYSTDNGATWTVLRDFIGSNVYTGRDFWYDSELGYEFFQGNGTLYNVGKSIDAGNTKVGLATVSYIEVTP